MIFGELDLQLLDRNEVADIVQVGAEDFTVRRLVARKQQSTLVVETEGICLGSRQVHGVKSTVGQVLTVRSTKRLAPDHLTSVGVMFRQVREAVFLRVGFPSTNVLNSVHVLVVGVDRDVTKASVLTGVELANEVDARIVGGDFHQCNLVGTNLTGVLDPTSRRVHPVVVGRVIVLFCVSSRRHDGAHGRRKHEAARARAVPEE